MKCGSVTNVGANIGSVVEGNVGNTSSHGDGPGDGSDGDVNSETGIHPTSPTRPDDTLMKIMALEMRSTKLENKVEELCTSLEYSQKEVDDLKAENLKMRLQLEDLTTEEERSKYQMKKIDDKVDKVETHGKKKNLIIEGLPEIGGGKEDVMKSIWELFDQIDVNKGVEIDTCFRVGGYMKNRTRPITVTFLRQGDRDLVYARRMNLKHSKEFKRVWINEDLGAVSSKTRNMIRLITRQAQQQGIDHKTGKYNIQIDNVRYGEHNLGDLPPPLNPSTLKQIQIDANTIAYQSEDAPFSNFYPSPMIVGKYTFNCLEQAFHFMHAKTMNKPLIAARIYLSRDPRDIKRMGDDLGTNELWEAKKFDIMYICLRRKFEQNEKLGQLLLDTGEFELVEATPSRLWGCGATLSSNALRRHEWPGENRQGKILMTVRDEMRRSHNTRAAAPFPSVLLTPP